MQQAIETSSRATSLWYDIKAMGTPSCLNGKDNILYDVCMQRETGVYPPRDIALYTLSLLQYCDYQVLISYPGFHHLFGMYLESLLSLKVMADPWVCKDAVQNLGICDCDAIKDLILSKSYNAFDHKNVISQVMSAINSAIMPLTRIPEDSIAKYRLYEMYLGDKKINLLFMILNQILITPTGV